MKKILPLFALLPFIACNQSNFEVTGIVKKIPDSTKAYIKVLQTDLTFKSIDSTYILNETFSIKGKWDNLPSNAILTIQDAAFVPYFILEKGKINIEIDDMNSLHYKLSGTESNDIYDKLIQTNEENHSLLSDIYATLNSAKTSQKEAIAQFENAVNIQNSLDTNTKTIIQNHIDYPIAALLIEQLYFRNAITSSNVLEYIETLKEENPFKERLLTYAKNQKISPVSGTEFKLSDFISEETITYNQVNLKANTILYVYNNMNDKTKEKFKDLEKIKSNTEKEFEIITLYIGSNIDNWKNNIDKDSQLLNLNISDLKSDVMKKYDLNTLPKSILINEKNEIINVISNQVNLYELIFETKNTK